MFVLYIRRTVLVYVHTKHRALSYSSPDSMYIISSSCISMFNTLICLINSCGLSQSWKDMLYIDSLYLCRCRHASIHPCHPSIHPSLPPYRPNYIPSHIHIDIQTCRHTDMQTYRHTDIQTYIRTDIQAFTHSHIHKHTHMCTYVNIYIYILIHTYIHYTVHMHMHWHLHILHCYIHPYVRLSTTVPKHLSPGTCIATSSLWLWTLKALNWIVTGLCAWCKCILDDLSCRRIADHMFAQLPGWGCCFWPAALSCLGHKLVVKYWLWL